MPVLCVVGAQWGNVKQVQVPIALVSVGGQRQKTVKVMQPYANK